MSEFESDMTGGSEFVKVVDTNLSTTGSENVAYVIPQGARNVSFTNLLASSASNQTSTWILPSSGNNVCRSSRIAIGMDVSASISVSNATASAINVIQGGNFGYRLRPLMNSVQNINHKLNEATIVVNNSDILNEVARLNVFPETENFYDNSSFNDEISSYRNATGSPLNPLESFSSANPSKYLVKPRTLNIRVVSGNNCPALGTTTVQITGTLYESLWSPFCNMGEDETSGYYGVNNETININWMANLFDSLFSFFLPTGLTLVSSSASLSPSQYLYLQYLTPTEDVLKTVPQKSVYRYSDYSVNNTSLGVPVVLANNASGDISVSNSMCNFSTVPRKILIYAKESNASTSALRPEKYLNIKNITATFNNGNPILSGATPNALWEISRKNGLQMPRSCWKSELLNANNSINGDLYGCGSVLCLSVLDLNLPESLSQSVGGRFPFTINITFNNPTNEIFSNPNLYIVGINEAVIVRDGSQYSNYLLNLSENMLPAMKNLPAIDRVSFEAHQKSESFAGGSLKDFLKKAYMRGHKAYNFIKKNRGAVEGMYNQARALTNEARGQSGGRLFGRK